MKRFVLLIVFLLCISVVHAEFDQEKALNWLDSSKHCIRDTTSIEELVFTTIALDSDDCLNQLRINRMGESGCFPEGNCNTKDTALGALALSANNRNVEDQLEYLNENLKGASEESKADWKIQVVIDEEGECTITYEGGSYSAVFDENGKINGGSWIGFNSLTGFSFDEAVETITVDCDFISTPKISIIKVKDNAFYIIEEKNSRVAEFIIENGCYSANVASSECNKDASFYASWVLSKLGEDISTNNFLESESEISSDLDYAMLASIDSSHLPVLVSRQDGGHFGNIKTTSFAVNAMGDYSNYDEEKDLAVNWVEEQQIENGKIGSGVMDTAVALYLIYGDVSYRGGDDDDDSGSGGIDECIFDEDCPLGYTCNPTTGDCELETVSGCNNNFECEVSLGEDALNCEDCECGDGTCDASENEFSCNLDCTGESLDCNKDGYCGFGENIVNCPLDCEKDSGSGGSQSVCGDGVCSLDEDDFTCSQDCESEEEGSLWWLWLIIIILILGGGGWFVYTKLKGDVNKIKPPSYLKPRMPPSQSRPQYRAPARRAPKDRTVENELDKSIKQAQDLLKKK